MATNQKTKTTPTAAKPKSANPKPATKKPKRKYPVKFDSSGFKLMFFVGLAMVAVGTLIVWASRTVPEGAKPTTSLNNTISRTIVQAMPASVTQWIATILGILFVLFGIFCLGMAVQTIIKYFAEKAKEEA